MGNRSRVIQASIAEKKKTPVKGDGKGGGAGAGNIKEKQTRDRMRGRQLWEIGPEIGGLRRKKTCD